MTQHAVEGALVVVPVAPLPDVAGREFPVFCRVVDAARPGPDGGRPVTEAVLETLAERIAAGVVEDLAARLDPLLHPPLRRGIASSGPAARRMPLAALLRRVAGRESADVDEAGLVDVVFKHVRAVFATLAEAVDAEE